MRLWKGGGGGRWVGEGLVFGIKYTEGINFYERREWMSELRYASLLSHENENYGSSVELQGTPRGG